MIYECLYKGPMEDHKLAELYEDEDSYLVLGIREATHPVDDSFKLFEVLMGPGKNVDEFRIRKVAGYLREYHDFNNVAHKVGGYFLPEGEAALQIFRDAWPEAKRWPLENGFVVTPPDSKVLT